MRMHPRASMVAPITFAICALCSAQVFAQPAPQNATPVGTWLNEDRDGIVEINDCGVLAGGAPDNFLCGKVVWLKNPIDPATGRPLADNKNVDPAQRGRPIMGMTPITQMQPSSTPGRWDGRVYDLDSGKTYDGSLIVRSASQMRVQGCLLIICQGEEWTRQAVPGARPPGAAARPANNGKPAAAPPAQPRAR